MKFQQLITWAHCQQLFRSCPILLILNSNDFWPNCLYWICMFDPSIAKLLRHTSTWTSEWSVRTLPLPISFIRIDHLLKKNIHYYPSPWTIWSTCIAEPFCAFYTTLSVLKYRQMDIGPDEIWENEKWDRFFERK